MHRFVRLFCLTNPAHKPINFSITSYLHSDPVEHPLLQDAPQVHAASPACLRAFCTQASDTITVDTVSTCGTIHAVRYNRPDSTACLRAFCTQASETITVDTVSTCGAIVLYSRPASPACLRAFCTQASETITVIPYPRVVL
jgi:hypothetical protein